MRCCLLEQFIVDNKISLNDFKVEKVGIFYCMQDKKGSHMLLTKIIDEDNTVEVTFDDDTKIKYRYNGKHWLVII